MEQASLAERLTDAEDAAPASPEVALQPKGKLSGEFLVLSQEAILPPALTPQSSGPTPADDFHTYHVPHWGINE